MRYEKLVSDSGNPLTNGLAEILKQGLELIEKIDDAAFTDQGRTSVGAHFRHCLDFVNGFLNGLKTGKIDYADRARDVNIEVNREYAASRLIFAIREVQSLLVEELEKPVMVKLEEISALMSEPAWAWSSGRRELDFVQSHTVHHFALIAHKLRQLGVQVEEKFGVAQSTLKFWEKDSQKELA